MEKIKPMRSVYYIVGFECTSLIGKSSECVQFECNDKSLHIKKDTTTTICQHLILI